MRKSEEREAGRGAGSREQCGEYREVGEETARVEEGQESVVRKEKKKQQKGRGIKASEEKKKKKKGEDCRWRGQSRSIIFTRTAHTRTPVLCHSIGSRHMTGAVWGRGKVFRGWLPFCHAAMLPAAWPGGSAAASGKEKRRGSKGPSTGLLSKVQGLSRRWYV